MIQNIFKKHGLHWLIFALLSLSLSGFYSIFVSMMRIPFVFKIFHHPDFFKISLIIHVTLSINIFFILFVFFLWSQDLKDIKKFKFFDNKFLIFASALITGFAIFLIAISGFMPSASALTINYIPVINNLVFFSGISLFFVNFFVFSLFYFFSFLVFNLKEIFKNTKIHLNFFIFFSSFIAFACLVSYLLKIKISDSIFDLEEFFWGFGHILQFTFIELSSLCLYLNFTENSNFLKTPINQNFLKILSFLKFLVLIISPFFYFLDDFNQFFTQQMKYALLIFLIPMNLYFAIILIKTKVIFKNFWNYIILGFVLSSFLGMLGGETAYFIKETNVMIPAHYHGSLIALTIIVMTFFYAFMQKIFFEHEIENFFTKKLKNLINMQIILYSVGHFMHVFGLILMGGYGALRKNPGNISSALKESFTIKIAKYIFFSGSLMSIIGGLLFIVVGFYFVFKILKISANKKILKN